MVLGVTNAGKNMDNEPRIMILFGKGKKYLITSCLV
jgi:hypothetical protein